MDAFLDGLASPAELRKHRIRLSGGDVVDLTELEKKLTEMGYQRESQIEGPGQFAVRGGIVDIFPLTEELPVRIELWGDEIDSIRSFDPESQRSVENLDEVTVYPASENWKEGMETVLFWNIFQKKRASFSWMSPSACRRARRSVEQEYFRSRENRIASDLDDVRVRTLQYMRRKISSDAMNLYSGIAMTTLESKCGMFRVREIYSIQTKGVNPYNNSFELLTTRPEALKEERIQGRPLIRIQNKGKASCGRS